ncbi:MAG: gamma carbonic anhydrase family protein [Thermaerobacter sp.]|nr:gamma carbonic anhydrase family protein [Thermaerobacter sp.]
MVLDFGQWSPEMDSPVFVAPGSYIVGQAKIGAYASIWFNAVVRADAEMIRIGPRCNIQDGTVLHADQGFPCLLGEGVTVGHRAIIHGAIIDSHVLVGMGSIIMNGAHIGSHCIVGAGTVVTEGENIPAGHLVLGSPGRVVRPVTDAERARIVAAAQHYVDLWLAQGWRFH